MAILTESEIVSYNAEKRELHLRYVIDGVERKKYFRNMPGDTPGHNACRDKWATLLVAEVDEKNAADAIDALAELGNWSSLPETNQNEIDHKRRVAQIAIRQAADLAREGVALQSKGRTRPEAAMKFMETRSILNKIIPNLTGNAAAKRNYLNLTPQEWGLSGGIKNYHDELQSTTAWVDAVTWMGSVTPVVEIDSPVNI